MSFRIGVLGGMGPLATQYFLEIFFRRYIAEMNPTRDQDFPDMTILMESSTPDRTTAIRQNDPSASERINDDLARLVDEGCDSIVVPCFTGHSMIDDKWFELGVIDIRSAAIEQYADRKGAKVGILATDGSLMSGVFEPMSEHFELIYPDKRIQKEIMKLIYDTKGENPDVAGGLRRLENIENAMHHKGADLYIAGCTEIEMFAGMNCASQRMIFPMNCFCTLLMKKIKEKNTVVKSL